MVIYAKILCSNASNYAWFCNSNCKLGVKKRAWGVPFWWWHKICLFTICFQFWRHFFFVPKHIQKWRKISKTICFRLVKNLLHSKNTLETWISIRLSENHDQNFRLNFYQSLPKTDKNLSIWVHKAKKIRMKSFITKLLF